MNVSETLRIAATIAARLERRGEPRSVEDAIARAEAAQLHMAQLNALREQYPDWDNTAIAPPLTEIVRLPAEISA